FFCFLPTTPSAGTKLPSKNNRRTKNAPKETKRSLRKPPQTPRGSKWSNTAPSTLPREPANTTTVPLIANHTTPRIGFFRYPTAHGTGVKRSTSLGGPHRPTNDRRATAVASARLPLLRLCQLRGRAKSVRRSPRFRCSGAAGDGGGGAGRSGPFFFVERPDRRPVTGGAASRALL
ncbi:unnamed protein product, partial [Ixodes pacificus]